MRRRRRLNLLLLAAVAALALAAWLLPRPAGGPAPVTPVAPAEVDALELRFPADAARPTLALERRRDGWHLTRPIARPARDGRVVSALGVLDARSESCYDAAERDPAEFGLAEPRLVLRADDTEVAFGDRAPDGRRYLRSGGRLCLVEDRSYPLLAGGLDGLAAPGLLPPGSTTVAIESPAAAAERATAASDWRMVRGAGDPERWANRWRGARAEAFVTEPPADDHGRVRVRTAAGDTHEWRIARRPPGLVLVPGDAGYGLVVPESLGEDLLEPPRTPPAGEAERE